MTRFLALWLSAAPAAALAAAPQHVLVVCSPGSPGTTAEAQPTMDAFAAALSKKAQVAPPLAAVYEASEDAGLKRLRAPDAALALVSLPFYLKHEKELGLKARLQAVAKGRPPLEVWTLVAKKGRVTGPSALDGFTIASTAGFAPAFVRGPALGGFGPLPAGVKVTQSAQVLSALRRAGTGDATAVLLDGPQGAALGSLPFAGELETVARSAPLPSGIVATVGARLPSKEWAAVEAALQALPSDPAGASAVAGLQMERFAPLDAPALDAARKAYADVAR